MLIKSSDITTASRLLQGDPKKWQRCFSNSKQKIKTSINYFIYAVSNLLSFIVLSLGQTVYSTTTAAVSNEVTSTTPTFVSHQNSHYKSTFLSPHMISNGPWTILIWYRIFTLFQLNLTFISPRLIFLKTFRIESRNYCSIIDVRFSGQSEWELDLCLPNILLLTHQSQTKPSNRFMSGNILPLGHICLFKNDIISKI